MKDKKITFPRAALKSLAQDLSTLVETSEGCLQALELIEEIPPELRPAVMEGLSSFYWQNMADFFQLMQLEYREMEKVLDRILVKYRMAGLDTNSFPNVEGSFYRAYASCTRHTGRVNLDIAWDVGGRGLYVENFFLTFSSDGLHSVFVIEDMSLLEFDRERILLTEMVELNFEECCYLIQEAYRFNMRFMSRPALGRFVYQKYLDTRLHLRDHDVQSLIHHLSLRLTPRQLINSVFRALKVHDDQYISAFTTPSCLQGGLLKEQLQQEMRPGAMLLEGKVISIHGSYEKVLANVYCISLYEREVYRSDYRFELVRDEDFGWLINRIIRMQRKMLAPDAESNPFGMHVLCRVYEIVNLDLLFDILDLMENIREVEELPYGIHMRVSNYEENLNHGISFMDGILGDLVINGAEFVIITPNSKNLEAFHRLFYQPQAAPLDFRAEYEVTLASAYHYLSGQYATFEDILLDDGNVYYEDGMRFLTARYMTKDHNAVTERLEQLSTLRLDMPGLYSIYYQTDGSEEEPGFIAEYILGDNWITLSAFGDRDTSVVRKIFEEGLYEALEFDGLEIREQGMFDILTAEVKKMYPWLESELKRMYLNKWYYSQLPTLSGMSPSEAVETDEGKRLLWTMFKRIRSQEKKFYKAGIPRRIGLREYLHRVDMQKDSKY